MKLSKQHLFITISLLLLSNNPILSQTDDSKLFEHTVVSVQNDIPGEDITIHCYSTEDDLGTHVLDYAKNFTWHFRINLRRSTKFNCDFSTKHGSGNYGVFTPNLYRRCDYQCDWLIRADGPCLKQPKHNNPLWCQKWKL
ncbi:hypothetical protein CASFOL_011855 [Castilleja foliolosa]|uniref:S-protein homolog n=1 Tax=Castilleja foliolosa TaxID=1961234 RepID=A0ABD3DPA7_9LAMI